MTCELQNETGGSLLRHIASSYDKFHGYGSRKVQKL